MKERTREEQEAVAEAAERQMRRWLLMHDIEQRLERERTAEELSNRLGPYIAISRQAGCGGGQIARLVAEKLGWELLDKKLLDFMAERYHLPRDILEFVDETTANWLHEIFGNWLDRCVVTQEEYVDHLGKIVLLAAQHGKVVFVGRGAQFVLPRDRGLAVRIIAPVPYRIEQTMRNRSLSRDQAKRSVDEADRGRAEFVRRYFLHDAADPLLYDLAINVERLGPQGAASLIVGCFRERFPE
ncbi:MAG: cytidylate kinase-like family protein [Planctomycetes bacterium]|nr:cytidylate kinase-like family protein [Planctomycetota bacterium]